MLPVFHQVEDGDEILSVMSGASRMSSVDSAQDPDTFVADPNDSPRKLISSMSFESPSKSFDSNSVASTPTGSMSCVTPKGTPGEGESEGPFRRNIANRTPAHSPMATATAVVAEVHVLESATTSAPSSQAPDVPEVTQTIDGLHTSLSAEREAWQKERSEMNNEIKKSRALLAVSESTMQLLQDENAELSGRLEGLIDTRESLRNENAVLAKKIQILTEELKTVRNENLELSSIAE
eukprot:gene2075-2473_t